MNESDLRITAPVFNIQSYSIHDGPGIRVTVFLKGCPLRCLWCANPESNLPVPQLMTYGSKCTGCGGCAAACPAGAVSLEVAGDKAVARTDRSLCTDCGVCVAACPADAREISGKTMTVQEVLDKVEADRLFIDGSGGGVTLSGGEPLAHVDFCAAFLRAAKESGLHTAVESCSFGSREAVDRLYADTDLAMLDIKHMDSETHRKITGVPNEPILDNIRYIRNTLKKEIMISLPCIPGYNDDDENILKTARFVAEELEGDVPIRLLPYHRLGESKRESLGGEMDFSITVPDDAHMNRLKALVESCGVRAQIGG